MPKTNLVDYTIGELQGLQRDVEKAIKEREQQELQSARERIFAVAKQAGVSIEELLGSGDKNAKTRGGRKAKPKYQNSQDITRTWTGRGRQPRWISEELANGKTLNDLLMN